MPGGDRCRRRLRRMPIRYPQRSRASPMRCRACWSVCQRRFALIFPSAGYRRPCYLVTYETDKSHELSAAKYIFHRVVSCSASAGGQEWRSPYKLRRPPCTVLTPRREVFMSHDVRMCRPTENRIGAALTAAHARTCADPWAASPRLPYRMREWRL
jgi:hypothetical protein